jgi:hypothetical protein
VGVASAKPKQRRWFPPFGQQEISVITEISCKVWRVDLITKKNSGSAHQNILRENRLGLWGGEPVGSVAVDITQVGTVEHLICTRVFFDLIQKAQRLPILAIGIGSIA